MEMILKKILIVLLLAVLVASTVSAADKFKSKQEEVGYAIGMNIGTSMRMQKLDIDADQLAAGIKAAFKGDKTTLSEAEMQQILTAFQQEIQQSQMSKAAAAVEEGKKFLAENGKKSGVVTLESGLQYKEIKAGSGAKPTAASTVKVNYRGTLVDGSEFDSSYSRGEPATFPVSQVIKGWTEALQLMEVGSKWELVVPAELAYGERSPGPTIPANSTLIFEVELLEIM